MPLVRGTHPGGTPPPVGTPTTPVPTRVVIPEPGVYTPVWIAPDETVLQLNPDFASGAERFTVKRGLSGLGVAPVELITAPAPAGGVAVDFTRRQPQTILWPLRIRGATHMEFLTEWRRVAGLFTQTSRLGPGKLRITRPDGSRREAIAWYSGGFEQEPDEGAWLQLTPVVKLLVPSGLWRAVDPTLFEATQQDDGDYLEPYPSIGTGSVIGTATLRNDGVAEAWPTWRIRGPMTQLVAVNVTRGQSFTLTTTLDEGEEVTIVSRPLTVTGPAGENLKGALNLLAGGKPWRLDPKKVSDVSFTVTGAVAESEPDADDGTNIFIEFYDEYEMS